MAAPTLSEKLEELRREFTEFRISVIREETAGKLTMSSSLEKLAEVRTIVEKIPERLAAIESRISALEAHTKALEKVSDRHWQVWLALGGAVLALLVSLLKK